jgi:hypothetical protein
MLKRTGLLLVSRICQYRFYVSNDLAVHMFGLLMQFLSFCVSVLEAFVFHFKTRILKNLLDKHDLS